MTLGHGRRLDFALLVCCLGGCGGGSSGPPTTVGGACDKSNAGFWTALQKCDSTASRGTSDDLWKSFCCSHIGTCGQPFAESDPTIYQQCSDGLALLSCADIVNKNFPTSCDFASASTTTTETSTSTSTDTGTTTNVPPCTPPTENTCTSNGCFSTNLFTGSAGYQGICYRGSDYSVYGGDSGHQLWIQANADGTASGSYALLGCTQTTVGCIPTVTKSYTAASVTLGDGFVQSTYSYQGTFCGYFVNGSTGISIEGSVQVATSSTSKCP
jgi:hypothetical protein